MPMIGALAGILPVLIILLVVAVSVSARGKQQRASHVDWHRILEEITQDDGESFPEEGSAFPDAEAPGADAIRAWAGTAPEPAFAVQTKLEAAYEEEGMGQHTAQGGEERHATRPAWMEPTSLEKDRRSAIDLNRMREAVILSEIIRPPLSKRRRERI